MGGHARKIKPARTGKLKGYCARCGMMLFLTESRCPSPLCGCLNVTSTPPEESKIFQKSKNNIRNYV